VGFECYRIGDLLLDAGTQEVTRDGTVLPVPRLSFKLLLSLARHAPNVVSVQQLEEEVWAGLIVDRGTVNKRVLLLRKALGGDMDGTPYIAVVRGSGYRLVVPVSRVSPVVEEHSSGDSSQKSFYQRKSVSLRTALYFLLGIIAAMVLYQGFRNASVESIEQSAEIDGATQSQLISASYSHNSIAVLPFVDLSEEQAHQYLGFGIAEEVIGLLAGMNGLQVAARTSSFAFHGTPSTMGEIASRLRVGTILEGSIRQSGGRLRVTAQLIDAQTGYHIWSQNYDRALSGVFEVQDDIALNIAQSLKLTLDETKQLDSGRSMTGDIEAFKLYLKGRELLNNRIHLREKGLLDALDYFNKAIELDPKFARAYAGIAMVYWLLTSYDQSLDQDTYFELAETNANFALEIDPDSVQALGALASICSKTGDLQGAAELFDRIRTIDGSNSNTIAWESTLHIRLGYFKELIKPLTERYNQDPLNEHIAWALADVLIFSGKPAEAVTVLEPLEDFSHRDYYLGLAAIYTGDYQVARELLRDVRMRSGVLPSAFADLLIDALEDPGMKEEVARVLLSAVENGEISELVGFESLLMLGSPHAFDLGIDPLNATINIQILAQLWINWAVDVRRDPGFKDWVTKLGYLEFWRNHTWPDRCRPTGPDDFECI
jgi:TolB-like protein/DNA-binding winged helix-turn-helix (wHTH) protein